MKRNAYFDSVLKNNLNGVNPLITNVLFNYAQCNYEDVVVDNYMSGYDWENLIQFLHRAGVKHFIYAENSTASMEGLCTLLATGKASVGKPVTLPKGFNVVPALEIKIPEKRK